MVIAMTAPKEPDDAIDWTGCDAVEVVRGRMSGVPVLRGTRMPVQAVIDNLAAGITPQEVAETWDLDLEQVLFAARHAGGG
jgi:uncharacterized protein (DUF433 family)